jgi:hypothetical protein
MKKLALVFPFILLALLACEDNKPTEPDDGDPITITQPSNNATVSGTVIVRATIGADYSMLRVVFYVDDDSFYTDTESPFAFEWETGVYEPGSAHTLSAIGYDDTSSYISNVVNVTIATPATNEFGYTASYMMPGPSFRVAAEGSHLFIAMGTIGLKALDISSPSSPVQVYEFEGTSDIRGVDSDSPYLVTAERDNGIRLFQISSAPDTIYPRAILSTGTSAWNVKVVNNVVFVADQDQLLIASISNYNFTVITYIPVTDGLVKDVDVSGANLYIMDNNGVTWYDVSNLADPVWRARYASFTGGCQSVSVFGNRVFVGTATELRMLTDSLTFVANVSQQTGFTGVYAINNVVFASQGGSNGGARAFDYSSGTSLVQLDAFIIDEICNDITYDNDYVYLAGQTRIEILHFVYSPTN